MGKRTALKPSAKLERCIQEVKKRNKTLPPNKRVNPFAVCRARIK